MGAKNNSRETKESAIAHWMAGRSQRWIADTLGVSPASVNAWVKGIEQKNIDLVNSQVIVKERLSQLPEQELNAITEHVDERTKHIKFFNDVTIKNISALSPKLNSELSIVEHKHAQETIAKAKETVLGKEASTQVNIQNNTTINAELVAGAKEQLQQRLAKLNGTRLIDTQ